jgi:hypothetical protein
MILYLIKKLIKKQFEIYMLKKDVKNISDQMDVIYLENQALKLTNEYLLLENARKDELLKK